MPQFEFKPFDKIARLKRELVITEKLDGSNAQVAIFELEGGEQVDACSYDPYCVDVIPGANLGDPPLAMYVASRKRWIAPEGLITVDEVSSKVRKGTDNFGFARWVHENSDELFKLGPGRHYGEWYGVGIQRGYDIPQKRFALFNTARWGDHNPNTPACCEVVYKFPAGTDPDEAMEDLATTGSQHILGFTRPEGIVVYHTASRTLFKQTFEQDAGKWKMPQ